MLDNISIVRFATSKDGPGIDRITQEYSEHEYSHAPKYFDDSISTQKIIISELHDEIVGYLIFHIVWGNTPYIELLRVSSPSQKKGIGSQMLHFLEEQLKTDGYSAVLSSSEKVNVVGNSFHEKNGFKSIGSLQMVYGEEVFYRKDLNSK